MMNTFFDTIVDIYDETRGFPKNTMNEIINALDEGIGDEKVLDLGVGTARFTHPLQLKGNTVVGVDISLSMLGRARSKGAADLVIGDACHLPFKNSSFDIIISVHLLHLVEDSGMVLREVKRVGKGKFLSVLFKKSAFNVMEEYKDALSGYGYYLETPGLGEKELKVLAVPETIIPISEFESLLSIKERISLLEQRKHSYSMETPSDIHNDAIMYLKKKHENNLDDHAKTEVEIVIWDISRLPSSVI
jgi:ubiquinone/menaquinone biosynthesis C-methylase UbiE